MRCSHGFSEVGKRVQCGCRRGSVSVKYFSLCLRLIWQLCHNNVISLCFRWSCASSIIVCAVVLCNYLCSAIGLPRCVDYATAGLPAVLLLKELLGVVSSWKRQCSREVRQLLTSVFFLKEMFLIWYSL